MCFSASPFFDGFHSEIDSSLNFLQSFFFCPSKGRTVGQFRNNSYTTFILFGTAESCGVAFAVLQKGD